MKKLAALIFISQLSFGQNTKIVVQLNEGQKAYTEYDFNICSPRYVKYYKKADEYSNFAPYTVIPCEKYGKVRDVIKAYYAGDEVYIEAEPDQYFEIGGNEVDLQAFRELLEKIPAEIVGQLKAKAEYESIEYAAEEFKELSAKIEQFNKLGIGILTWRPYDDYSMTGAEFEIYNGSKKTIKYITFNFYGINAVGDKVGESKSRKGIGPVEYMETAKWSFDTVWLTDIIQRLKLTSVNIIYMDGSTRTLPISEKYWMDRNILTRMSALASD